MGPKFKGIGAGKAYLLSVSIGAAAGYGRPTFIGEWQAVFFSFYCWWSLAFEDPCNHLRYH